MIFKNSEEYDEILHVGVDLDFIESFFVANKDDLDKAKAQLLEIYIKEYQSNLQKSITPKEKGLASALNNRNIALIESQYSRFKVKQIETEANSNMLSPQKTVERAELNYEIAENNLKIEQITVSLLKVARSVDSSIIWGKARDTGLYDEMFVSRTTQPENYDLANESTWLPVDVCKCYLELAQVQLNEINQYLTEQNVDKRL